MSPTTDGGPSTALDSPGTPGTAASEVPGKKEMGIEERAIESQPQQQRGQGISEATIAGIVGTAVFLAFLVTAGAVLVMRRRKVQRQHTASTAVCILPVPLAQRSMNVLFRKEVIAN